MRMRDRWRTVSRLWEENKAAANKLDLLGQLDYYGKLSSQLDGRKILAIGRFAGVYQGALLRRRCLKMMKGLVDNTLYWITCKDVEEAYYLLAIINSDALANAGNKST